MLAGLIISGALIGIIVGLTGIGGILLPPSMIFILGMNTHLAMGTSMTSMIPTMLYGLYLQNKQGNVDWGKALPLTLAGGVCVFIGTELKALASGNTLNLLLGLFILVVGAMSFRRQKTAHPGVDRAPATTRDRVKLALLGAAVGIVAGMTGAGGAVLTTPAMIVMGFSPLEAIGAGFAYGVLVCTAGTVGNVLHDAVDLSYALWSAVGQMIGVWLGSLIARFCSVRVLQYLVATMCVLTGIGMCVKTYLS